MKEDFLQKRQPKLMLKFSLVWQSNESPYFTLTFRRMALTKLSKVAIISPSWRNRQRKLSEIKT